MDLLPAYRELVCSPAQLALCAQARGVAGFLGQLRRLWRLDDAMGDDALVAGLNHCNRQVLDLHPRQLEGQWFPHQYRADTRSLGWCLPQGHATEPFLDQYVERCRRQGMVNQFIQPRTSASPLLAEAAPAPTLAGAIFHLSRCGSTLVSGCLSELDDTSVLSESPLLTAALLDGSLSAAQKRYLLPWLVRLQAAAFPGRDRVVVKFNAWDLLAWPVLSAAFPGVPTLLLLRSPEEILASHAREAGRHMSGDPSLAALGPAFGPMAEDENLLDRRIAVLDDLMQAMSGIAGGAGARVLDYTQLDEAGLAAICRHFGLAPGVDAQARMAARTRVHSKAPERAFEGDAERKRRHFDQARRRRIDARLGSAYRALLASAAAPRRATEPTP